MRLRIAVLLGAAVLLLAAQGAMADAISAVNDRPGVPVATTSGEPSLQSLLNQVFACNNCISAITDQQKAGMWGLRTAPGAITPILQFENAGLAPYNEIGIWYGADSNSITRVPIFAGSAAAPSVATVYWTGDSTGFVFGMGGSSAFSGIPYSNFGFYLHTEGTATYFYSVDSLNPNGSAQVLAYQQLPNNLWALAFEDTQVSSSNIGDYNDAVISVESMLPVPEPASMILLGTGLFGVGVTLRRRTMARRND